MIQSPKSLTATIHVRFHYRDPESEPVTEGETQIIDKLLSHAGDLAPELQELLIKFASYLREQSGNGNNQAT